MTEEKTNPDSSIVTNKAASDSPRITNIQKEKDPRKVAAGKKLGTISKMAKNQKKYKAEAHDSEEAFSRAEAQSSADSNPGYSTAFYAVFAVVVVGCLGTLYWNKKPQPKQDLSPSARLTFGSVPKPQDAPEAPTFGSGPNFRTTNSNLISLD